MIIVIAIAEAMVETEDKHNIIIIIKNIQRNEENIVLQEKEDMTNLKFVVILTIKLIIIYWNIDIMILTKLIRSLTICKK